MIKSGLTISQTDNFNANFGEVLRSSSIFYFARTASVRTTISLMNYWRFKRETSVAIIATLRDMSGVLVHRTRLAFDPGHVINYSPEVDDGFEGSLEIEAISAENLVIPYAAVMTVIEARKSISMVHSYARAYSQHEIDEGRTITLGREGCWRIVDDLKTSSFCVFHNGPEWQKAQTLSLEVICEKESAHADISLPALRPFQTVKLQPRDHIVGLVDWLAGRTGYASVSFDLGQAFTRMLVGNELIDGSEVSITHSNFDYRRHTTETVDGCTEAFMRVPPSLLGSARVIVYPHFHAGQYEAHEGATHHFTSNTPLSFVPSESTIQFGSAGGAFPARLVTGIEVPSQGHLSAECSLGVYHARRPLKRTHWGIVAEKDGLSSRIIGLPFDCIYGAPKGNVTAKLFSAKTNEILTAEWTLTPNDSQEFSWALTDIFPNARAHLGDAFGFVYMVSEYGGLQCFSQLTKENGSTTIEHMF